MIRLRLFLAVAAIIAALTAFSSAPALAQPDDWDWWDGDNPEESWDSEDEWEDLWGWDDLDITETEWEDGSLEFEGETTFWGEPAEVEFVCSDWWSCDLTEVDV